MSKYRYLYRNFALMSVVYFLISALVYFLSISDTVQLYTEYNELKKKESNLSDVHSRISQLKEKLSDVEKKLGYGSTSASLNLLQELSNYCTNQKIELKSIPSLEEYQEDGIVFQNQAFVVQGSFNKILSLLNSLEQHDKIGRLISVNYAVTEDLRSKKRILSAYCVVQNILIEDYEI